MIEIRYIRTSTLLIEWDGLRVLTDPWFAMHMRGLPVFVRPCLSPETLPPLNLTLVSHTHPDHYDAAAVSRLATPCELTLGPPQLAGKTPAQAGRVVTMTDGDAIDDPRYTVRAYSVPHSGYENAYLVTRNGMSLLFAGDAKYSPVFAEIGRTAPPTVSLLPAGGTIALGRRIVMGPADAVRAATDLKTKVLIPTHLGGEWMSVPPLSLHPGRADKVVRLAEEANAPFAVAALRPGQSVRVSEDGAVVHPEPEPPGGNR